MNYAAMIKTRDTAAAIAATRGAAAILEVRTAAGAKSDALWLNKSTADIRVPLNS